MKYEDLNQFKNYYENNISIENALDFASKIENLEERYKFWNEFYYFRLREFNLRNKARVSEWF